MTRGNVTTCGHPSVFHLVRSLSVPAGPVVNYRKNISSPEKMGPLLPRLPEGKESHHEAAAESEMAPWLAMQSPDHQCEMQPFIPEDYLESFLCAPQHHVRSSMLMKTDPFEDDFEYAKPALASEDSETTDECTKSVPKFVRSSFIEDMQTSKVDCIVKGDSIKPQVQSGSVEAGPQDGLSQTSPAQPGKVYTEGDMNEDCVATDKSLREVSGITCLRSMAPAGVCIITSEAARKIFMSRAMRRKNDGLASRLGQDFGISAKAVRDIWRLRTWAHATQTYWTPEDMRNQLKKKLTSTHCRTSV